MRYSIILLFIFKSFVGISQDQIKPSLNLQLGSQGIGAGAKMPVSQKLNASVSVNFLQFQTSNLFFIKRTDIKPQAKVQATNANVLMEFMPFENSAFRLVGGAGYFLSAYGMGQIQPKATMYGDIELTEETMGKVEVKSNWKGLAPYLGIGLLKKTSEEERIYVNLDLGTYYMPKPDVTITATNMLKHMKENEAIINNNVKNYRWLPVFSVKINYSLNRK